MKKFIILLFLAMIIFSVITVFAEDIPESCIEEGTQMFFGEVTANHHSFTKDQEVIL